MKKTLLNMFENVIGTGDIAIIPAEPKKSKSSKSKIRYRMMESGKIKPINEEVPEQQESKNITVKSEISTKPKDIVNNIHDKINILNKDIVTCGAQIDDDKIIQFYVKPDNETQLQITLDQMISQGSKLDQILKQLDNLYVSFRIYQVITNYEDIIGNDMTVKSRDLKNDAANLGVYNQTPNDKYDSFYNFPNANQAYV